MPPSVELNGPGAGVWSPTVVLEVRKVITMLEECCPL